VEILPLQYRSQVQSGSNMVFWFIAFLAVYFGGQVASSPNVGALIILIYIWFCLGGGIVTTLSWFFVESKCGKNLMFRDNMAVILPS
jgi:ABC-type multidrug transport system permease subunit